MRAVVQRVTSASVAVDGSTVGAISRGLLVFLGVGHDDTGATAERLARKIAGLRIFEDDDGRMNRSCAEAGGDVLCISQFTLYGDVRRGNRPSFTDAAPPETAEHLYRAFCVGIEAEGLRCEQGVFGADMEVAIVNDGPVTLVLDTADLDRPRRA